MRVDGHSGTALYQVRTLTDELLDDLLYLVWLLCDHHHREAAVGHLSLLLREESRGPLAPLALSLHDHLCSRRRSVAPTLRRPSHAPRLALGVAVETRTQPSGTDASDASVFVSPSASVYSDIIRIISIPYLNLLYGNGGG